MLRGLGIEPLLPAVWAARSVLTQRNGGHKAPGESTLIAVIGKSGCWLWREQELSQPFHAFGNGLSAEQRLLKEL